MQILALSDHNFNGKVSSILENKRFKSSIRHKMKIKTQFPEFEKAFNKARKGKKKISDKEFIKYYSNDPKNLNSLGKFFYNKEASEIAVEKLANDFYSKLYKPNKYTCVILPKGNGDYRTILVPNPKDRILFSVILERIKPQLLPEINKYKVFGSGKRKDLPNIKSIIEEIYKTSKKYKFILKIDIKKFFPSIDREDLLKKLSYKIENEYILNIIKMSFYNPVDYKFDKKMKENDKEKIIKSVSSGIPQGCSYSPLLANYYGLDLDKIVEEKKYTSFRYLDDMIIFVNSMGEATGLFSDLKLVANKLKLEIHEISEKKKNKTYIQQSNKSFEYLGINIKPNGEFEIPIEKVKKEINLIKNEIFNIRTINKFGANKVINSLYLQLRGWKYYYKSNFFTAYLSLNKDVYNKQLKQYYSRQMYHNRLMKKTLIKAQFNIGDQKYYF